MIFEEFEETADVLATINPYCINRELTLSMMRCLAYVARDEKAIFCAQGGAMVTVYTGPDGRKRARATVTSYTVTSFLKRCTVAPRDMVIGDI